jgi:hypothetical protein
MTIKSVPAANLGLSYINGLQLAWTANTKVVVSSGQCRDSNNIYDLVLSSKSIDAGTNGVNGLDTGSLGASTMYYVFVIGDSTGYKATGLLLSLSDTDPTMPFGYDLMRKIGSVATDGSSHFILFYQSGNGSTRPCTYDEPVSVLSGGTATSFTAVSLTGIVPPVSKIPVKLLAIYTPNAAGDTAAIRPVNGTTTTGTVLKGSVAAVAQDLQLDAIALLDSGVAKIDYKVTASDTLSLYVIGYTDFL